jgi:hypothetical protein
MKSLLITIGLFALCNSARSESPLRFEPDIVVRYSSKGLLDIGVKRAVGTTDEMVSVAHTVHELRPYFEAQKHKDGILIVVAKNDWDDAKVKLVTSEISDYFTTLGYRRIVIQQAMGNAAQIILLDSNP